MVWGQNYHRIREHNAGNHSFSLSLNEFADMVSSLEIGHWISYKSSSNVGFILAQAALVQLPSLTCMCGHSLAQSVLQ